MDLRAGAASIDITPPVGVLLDGYGGRTQPSEAVHDPLFARVLLLDYGDQGAAVIVGCDLLGMHPWITAEVRRQAERAYGIAPDAVIVAATHNHAGPVGLREGMFSRLDEGLAEKVAAKIGSAIGEAWKSRRPATIKTGSATVETVSMNRRDPAGPRDTSLRVALFESGDGPIACLVNFACHATVLDGRNLQLSAEFPGVACRTIEQATGARAVYLNGACGDVNPAWIEQEFPSVERAGQAVGGAAVALIADLRAAGRGLRSHNIRWDEYLPLASPGREVEPNLTFSRREIELPLREFAADDEYSRFIEAAREEAGGQAEGSGGRRAAMAQLSRWEGERWAAAWARRSVASGVRRTEVQSLSFGEGLAVLAMPGEFFAETAEAIRTEVGAEDLLVACYANDYVGYVVPTDAYDEGGYETGVTFFAQEAERIIRDTSVEMVRQVTGKW